jgi:hypothetical protein
MKSSQIRWQEGSRLDLFLTAANMLGYPNAPLAWGVSSVNWKTKSDMVSFLEDLTLPPEAKGAANG